MSIMTKRILVNLPAEMYQVLKQAAKSEYKSVSGFIRESIVYRLNDGLTPKEVALIEKGRSEYRQGKGVNWRSVRGGSRQPSRGIRNQ